MRNGGGDVQFCNTTLLRFDFFRNPLSAGLATLVKQHERGEKRVEEITAMHGSGPDLRRD
ncbi:MAG: hypothetical protein DYG96_08960 [Chlorobi bacterium CHB2]|nr:hypothetical protein [Chlorobi bacterium CHB2]